MRPSSLNLERLQRRGFKTRRMLHALKESNGKALSQAPTTYLISSLARTTSSQGVSFQHDTQAAPLKIFSRQSFEVQPPERPNPEMQHALSIAKVLRIGKVEEMRSGDVLKADGRLLWSAWSAHVET